MVKPNAVVLDWSTMSTSGTDGVSYAPIESLCESLRVYGLTPYDEASVVERVGDADVLLCNKVPITRGVMQACRRLRYVGLFATGYNNVDVQAARELGVTVCNAGEYSTNAVAQHVFAMVLDHYSKVAQYGRDVEDGGWIASKTFSYFPYETYELAGKTISVVGYGSIGRRVCRIASAFGMEVLVHTRTKPLDCPYELVSKEEAFRRADVLTLHCPLTEQTSRMVCRDTLSLMKPSAVLVNTSRGGTVDERALSEALEAGTIAKAYLDVLDVEPMSKDSPILHAPNVVVTPHVAWSPLETRNRLVGIVAGNLEGFLCGSVTNRVV